MSVSEGWQTIALAAEYAAASKITIRRAIHAGDLESVGSGKLIRTRAEWVDEWLRNRTKAKRP